MSDRFGTFMFIPHENSNVRSFRTTRRSIVGALCIALGVLALAAGAGAWLVSGGRPGAAPALARENEQVTGVERMWVLRTSGLAEARAAEQTFASNGKLSVDTFSK